MYGTLGRMKVKPGKVDGVVAHLRAPRLRECPRADRDTRRGGGRRGRIGITRAYGLLIADEGGEVVVAVMYEDKDAYFTMVHDPAIGRAVRILETIARAPQTPSSSSSRSEPTWAKQQERRWIAGPSDPR